MSEDKFRIQFIALICATIVAIVAFGVAHSVLENHYIARMVEGGADPIAARCATGGRELMRECLLARPQVNNVNGTSL